MATINTLIFSSIMMATAVSPLYENLLGEEIIFKRLDSTSISLPPQAVRYEQDPDGDDNNLDYGPLDSFGNLQVINPEILEEIIIRDTQILEESQYYLKILL